MTDRRIAALLVAAALLGTAGVSAAPDGPPATQPATAALDERLHRQRAQIIARASAFLLTRQDRDGAWAGETGPGITAIVTRALADVPEIGPRHPAVQRGVAFVERFAHEDGGVYGAGGLLKSYETSVALAMFARVDRDRFAARIQAARDFVKALQWDEGEGRSIDDPWYGGAGYGRHARPDLSNTQVMLQALRDSGLPESDPAYRKALVFVQRCQMLGEHNDQPFARGSTQGGFIYTAANGGESKAGTLPDSAELRSYGSMTYAAFKSMIYAGLQADDPRIAAALDWIGRHWTLDYNPNMPEAQSREGLFYYYVVFARALEAFGRDEITDARGRRHNWRAELIRKLAGLQQDDGGFRNEADRWFEGRPELASAYALLALQATEETETK